MVIPNPQDATIIVKRIKFSVPTLSIHLTSPCVRNTLTNIKVESEGEYIGFVSGWTSALSARSTPSPRCSTDL